MGTRWDVQSHEDRYSCGIPDLSFGVGGTNGWIELKQIECWPVKAATLVKPKKYTPEQVNWLLRRSKKGGSCYVMVKVGRDDYFLFAGGKARKIRKGMTRADYSCECIAHWRKNIPPDHLIKLIKYGWTSW